MQDSNKIISDVDRDKLLSSVVLFDNVTIADLYKKIDDSCNEERAIALEFLNAIKGLIYENGEFDDEKKTVKFENMYLLAPIINDLMKVIGSTTDNRIKALNAAQKIVVPDPKFVQQFLMKSSDQHERAEDNSMDVSQIIGDMNIFLDKEPNDQAIKEDLSLEEHIDELDNDEDDDDGDIPIIHSPSWKNNRTQ